MNERARLRARDRALFPNSHRRRWTRRPRWPAGSPRADIVTQSCSSPGVANGTGDEVRHQRDLELVEVQGRGAARRRLPGELGDVRIERLALDDPLDGDEPP